MKIAYCFGGHLRSYARNDTLLRNLIGPNSPDYDVFVHTYSVMNSPTPLWHRDNGLSDIPVTAMNEKQIRARYLNVRSFEIDTATGGDRHLPDYASKVGGRYTFERVITTCLEYGTYDLVFYGRFDLLFQEPLRLHAPQPDTVYGSYNPVAIKRGLDGDVFVYGTPEAMRKLACPAAPPEHEEIIRSCGFVGEALTTAVRKDRGLYYSAHPVKLSILRTDGKEQVVW